MEVSKYAGTGEDDASFGTDAWTSPGNITANDSSYATTDNVFQYSHYLKGTNFGFTIPTTATINGIVLEIERWNPEAFKLCDEARVRIVKGGVVGSTERGDVGVSWTDTPLVKTYGSSSDLWGETWTPSDINATNFGAVLATEWHSGFYPHPTVNYFRITIYYTLAIISDVFSGFGRRILSNRHGIYQPIGPKGIIIS